VGQQTVVRKVVLPEQVTYPTAHILGAGEKMPSLGISFLRCGILIEGLRRVVDPVKGHGEHDQIALKPVSKSLLEGAKIVRTTQTELGKCASRIDEVQNCDLTRNRAKLTDLPSCPAKVKSGTASPTFSERGELSAALASSFRRCAVAGSGSKP
jgi:hypothetical protein